MKKAKEHSISELDELFKEAYDLDCRLHSEQRGNVKLYNGIHYGEKYKDLERTIKGYSGETDKFVKVTENHINKIVKTVANTIKSQLPDVAIKPKNPEEYQDQKRAEIHHSVLQDWKENSPFMKNQTRHINDWIIYGEFFTKTFWNDEAGRRLPDIVSQEVEIEENDKRGKTSELEVELKKPKVIKRFEGDVQIEVIRPDNVVRDPAAYNFDEAKWIAIKKLVCPELLKSKFERDDRRWDLIQSCKGERYSAYSHSNDKYVETKNQVLVKEYYFRPSARYPEGYYFITVGSGKGDKKGILFKGELPGGIFPIDVLGFDEIATSPRYSSIIRQLRSKQHKLNMMVSKMFEHMLRMGDTKVFIRKGSKITKAKKINGYRISEFTGDTPVFQEGQIGAQFVNPIASEITSMYSLVNLQEMLNGVDTKVDARTALYLNAKQKSYYSEYLGKYESFLKSICEKVLRFKKLYLQEEALVMIAGKDEYLNVAEYKSTEDLGYEIAFEGVQSDADTKLGRALDMGQILQYAANFPVEERAQMIKAMPFLNNEMITEGMTQDWDNARNTILALDRGDQRALEVRQYENHDYMIQALVTRMKKPDFYNLAFEVQQLYAQKVQIHEQVKAQEIERAARIEQGMIPSSGALLNTDFYITDGVTTRGEPKTKRLKLPSDAINWLSGALQKQGSTLDQLEQQQSQVRAEIVDQVMNEQLQNQQQAEMMQIMEQQGLAGGF